MAKKGYNFLNGGKVLTSQNEQSLDKWHAIGKETGMDPVLAILGTEEVESKYRGQIRVTKSVSARRHFPTRNLQISSASRMKPEYR